MLRSTLIIALCGGLMACSSKADSGDSGVSEPEGAADVVDSCQYDDDTCAEFVNFADTETWCTSVSAQYGLSWTYVADACPSGAVLECAIPASGDYTHPATVYYYDSGEDNESTCTGAGGTVLP